jgi:hypothetical protein
MAPPSKLPFNRKPTPPNIFFSSMYLRRANASRMRRARASLKAIGDSILVVLRRSLTIKYRVSYPNAEK